MHKKLVQALYDESRKRPMTQSPFTQEQVEFVCEDLFRTNERIVELEEALHLILIQRENFTDDAARNIYKLASEALRTKATEKDNLT